MKLPWRIEIPKPYPTFWVHLGLAILFGGFWAILLYGRFHLNPTRVSWIINAGGDALQHQLGWEWFRLESWQFPLGKISAYGYPFGTSITFMDSIPLFAIPFKLIAPWLPQNFQYFGIWELGSIIGQMLVGMLILHEFTRSYPLKLLGASLLVLSPPLIFRALYHSSLSAHWILLAAIWFVILESRHKMWHPGWILLFGVATWIHVYFIPMLIPLWIIGMVFYYRRSAHKGWAALEVLGVVLVFFLAGYVIGLFSLSYDALSVKDYGYGIFSWNLNGFLDPFNFSSNLIKDLQTYSPAQLEGFSYLGLGNLILLPVALYLFFTRENLRQRLPLFLMFLAISCGYILFALSNRAFLSSQVLWKIQLPDEVQKFLNMFRTSGRFIWPVFYFLVLFGLVQVIRGIRYPAVVLAFAILLQLGDIQPLIQLKKETGVENKPAVLASEFWQAAGKANRHLVILPETDLSNDYEPFAWYALQNRLTMNLGYFARSDERALAGYNQQVWTALLAKQPDPQTLYILTDPEWGLQAQTRLASDLFICKIDEFQVLFAKDNALAKSGLDLGQSCQVPGP
jgi:hypothetical protein